jgi:hypothetical protein
MKQKIEDLIAHHKQAKIEVNFLLEELNQIDTSKLSYQEVDSLRETEMKYSDELYFRRLFIQDLESLL